MEITKVAAVLWLLCTVPLLAEIVPLHSNSVSATSASAQANPNGQEIILLYSLTSRCLYVCGDLDW
jgi:hypothetical protein